MPRHVIWLVLALALLAASCLSWLGTNFGRELPLRYELEVVEAGGGAAARLTVTNPQQRAVDLRFPTSQRYDFVVRRKGGEVWRWSRDKGFLMVVTTDRIGPGETFTYTEALPGLTPGTYTVEAYFLAERPAGAVARSTWTVR